MVSVALDNMDGIMTFNNIIVTTFNKIMDWFQFSIGEMLQNLALTGDFFAPLVNAINSVLSNLTWNGQPINEIQFIELLIGGALLFYVVWQLLTWLLNIAT